MVRLGCLDRTSGSTHCAGLGKLGMAIQGRREVRVRVPSSKRRAHTWESEMDWSKPMHQGNFDGKIIHYNHQKGVDNDRYGIIIHYQPPFGDYNGLSFHQNFPNDGTARHLLGVNSTAAVILL